MRWLLPLLLGLAGLAAGVGAGVVLRPEALESGTAKDHHTADEHADEPEAKHEPDQTTESEREFVRLNNQFVVPIVSDGRVISLVVMSVSLEVSSGSRERVFAFEPKLRDLFLQVLFDHANAGGFDGSFTTSSNMRTLRTALNEAARSVLGDDVSQVLIIDLMRQDS